jgi:hypothetical protein
LPLTTLDNENTQVQIDGNYLLSLATQTDLPSSDEESQISSLNTNDEHIDEAEVSLPNRTENDSNTAANDDAVNKTTTNHDSQEDSHNEAESNPEEDTDAEETDSEEMMLNRELNQNRQPQKQDNVVLYSESKDEWYRVRLTSGMNPRYQFYYNCQFPDGKQGGVYLIPGQLWSFEPEHDETSDEGSGDQLSPVENTRNSTSKGQAETPFQVTPDISVGSEEYFEDGFDSMQLHHTVDYSAAKEEEHLEPSEQTYNDNTIEEIEVNKTLATLDKAFSVSHPNLGLPRNLIIEEDRVYNLTEALDLHIPLHSNFTLSRTYLIAANPEYHLLYRQNPLIDTDKHPIRRFKFLPKFVSRLNPFRKKS